MNERFFSQRFETMPSQVRDIILFCTNAVEWSLGERIRYKGDVVKIRKELTELYDAIQNEENDEENLPSKLMKYSDLHNGLVNEFNFIKAKYKELQEADDVKRARYLSAKKGGEPLNTKLIKIEEVELEEEPHLFYVEYPDKHVFSGEVFATRLLTSTEVEFIFDKIISAVDECDSEKPIELSLEMNMTLGDRCRRNRHVDHVAINMQWKFSSDIKQAGLFIEIQEMYDKNNYVDGTFDDNDFIKDFSNYYEYDNEKSEIKLIDGQKMRASLEKYEERKHSEDDCCQRDMTLYLQNNDRDILKGIAQTLLSYFSEHQKVKRK